MPVPSGPRHAGQLADNAAGARERKKENQNARGRELVFIEEK
jgi:hypothetical protein